MARQHTVECSGEDAATRADKRPASSAVAVGPHETQSHAQSQPVGAREQGGLHSHNEGLHTFSSFEALPLEVLYNILAELPFQDLLCMYFVSRHLRSILPPVCDLTKAELMKLFFESESRSAADVEARNELRAASIIWQARFPRAFKLKELTCTGCHDFVPSATEFRGGLHCSNGELHCLNGFPDEHFDRLRLDRSCIHCLQSELDVDDDVSEEVFHVGGEPWYICQQHGYHFFSVRDAPSDEDVRSSSTHYGMPSSQDIDPQRTCAYCFREVVGMRRFDTENALPSGTIINKLTCSCCYGLHGPSTDALDGFADDGLDASNRRRRCIPCLKRYRTTLGLQREINVRGRKYRACVRDHWAEDEGRWHTAIFQGIVGRDLRYRQEVDICNACYQVLIQNTGEVLSEDGGHKYKLVPKRHGLPDLWKVEAK